MTLRSFLVAALLAASPLHAQMRRGAPDGAAGAPAQPTLPLIAPDPARFFVGVWQGTFVGPYNDSARMTVALEWANGGYAGYSAMAGEPRLHPHATDSVIGDSLVWTQPNMNNNGTLFFIAKRTGPDTFRGYMVLRNAPNGGPEGRQPTFTLRRVRPSR